MWIPVLLVAAILISYWQFTLIGLAIWFGIWALWTWIKRCAEDTPPKRKQLPPVSVSVRPSRPKRPKRPAPVPELPAPSYLPRWTTTRRFHENRAKDQWELEFDRRA